MGNKGRLEKYILNTLFYRSIFQYPLSLSEICDFLLKDKSDLGTDVKEKEVFKALTGNLKGVIKSKNGFFSIKGLPEENFLRRNDFEREGKRKILYAQKKLKPLARVPFIQMVGITGSVGALSCGEEDDIDLFIVCKKHTLWVTRLIVTLYMKIMGIYLNESNPRDTFCPNIYISLHNLSWPEEKRNVHSAHEVVLLKPILSKNNCYEIFITSNLWAKSYLFNHPLFKGVAKMDGSSGFRNKAGWAVSFLDATLMVAQIFYMRMRGKVSTEVLTRDLIHFKKNDNSARILNKFSNLAPKKNLDREF